MTNEEIEKRFLFDLNMGRFNSCKSGDNLIIFISKFITKRNERFKFYYFLLNLGFRLMDGYSINSTFKADTCFDLNPNTMKISLRPTDPFFIRDKTYNEIPDYVKEYQIE